MTTSNTPEAPIKGSIAFETQNLVNAWIADAYGEEKDDQNSEFTPKMSPEEQAAWGNLFAGAANGQAPANNQENQAKITQPDYQSTASYQAKQPQAHASNG